MPISRVPSSRCAISCSKPRRTPEMPPNTSAVLSASMRKMLARLASALAASALPRVASSWTMRQAWNTPASAITRASRIGIVPSSEWSVALLDDAAAEADLAVVEHDRLARASPRAAARRRTTSQDAPEMRTSQA